MCVCVCVGQSCHTKAARECQKQRPKIDARKRRARVAATRESRRKRSETRSRARSIRMASNLIGNLDNDFLPPAAAASAAAAAKAATAQTSLPAPLRLVSRRAPQYDKCANQSNRELHSHKSCDIASARARATQPRKVVQHEPIDQIIWSDNPSFICLFLVVGVLSPLAARY